MSDHNTPDLKTENLILRKFTKNDIEALFTIYSDPEVNTFLPWFPLKTIEEARIFFEEKYNRDYQNSRGYRYAICLKGDNVPVGYVNISMYESHDMGYGLLKKWWHKGITTEACRAVLKRAKKDGILYVTATHDIKNPRSGEVMKRLGMIYKYTYLELWQPKNIEVLFRMYQLNFDGMTDRVYKKYWEKAETKFVEEGV